MKEIRHHARFLYPGSFFTEEGRLIRTDAPTVEQVLKVAPDGEWFGARVTSSEWTRYTSDEGDVTWQRTGRPSSFHVYLGEEFTTEQVEQLPGDHGILIANMRGNGWAKVARTRCGNWQPVEDGDIVVSPAKV